MKLENTRIILTGAGGGIGSQIAAGLARAGAHLLLVDREPDALQQLTKQLGESCAATVADLTRAEDRQAVVRTAQDALGGVDALINNAGLLDFTPFETEDPRSIERLVAVNVIAPMLLTRAVLPQLLAQGSGRIVNVGSTFGSIGFPYFAAYSASKFAIRGFSEALRRELDGTGVGVTYIAPRATRTSLNSDAVYRMNTALNIHMDTPEVVAATVIDAIRKDLGEVYVGWLESFFARLNGVLPRVVDGALRKQKREMRKYARGT